MFSFNKRILVVDDSLLNIKIIEKYLDSQYIEIIGCTEPKKAIDLISQINPDLILLDLYMPEMNGFELIKEIKKDSRNSLIPILFITGSKKIKDAKNSYKLGAIDYIQKPILKEELISKINHYLFHIEEKKILERYIKIIDNYVLSIITDMNFIVLYISKAFCEKLMLPSKEEIYGISLKELINNEKQEKIWDNIEFALQKNFWKGKLLFKNNQDIYFWTETTIETIFDNTMNPIGYQMICFDLTEKLALQELSIRDPLTKIYNRNKIIELIDYEIQSAKRYSTTFSLIMLDIDDFKNINDTFGHNFGDMVLIELTKIINKSIRNIDVVGRWGGEEFLIVLPKTNVINSINVAERLKENFSTSIITYNGISLPLNTSSFGITEFKKNDSLITILERVDQSLYKSKNKGKNQITIL